MDESTIHIRCRDFASDCDAEVNAGVGRPLEGETHKAIFCFLNTIVLVILNSDSIVGSNSKVRLFLLYITFIHWLIYINHCSIFCGLSVYFGHPTGHAPRVD